MKLTNACVLACLATVDARSSEGSPVEKIVDLLSGVLSRTQADGKAEQQIYDKFACWCETTVKRKAGAITQGQIDMRKLGQQILTLKGKIATLTTEIEELEAAIKKNIKEQEEATSLRSRENADFVAEATETKEAIAAMQQAITVLGEGTSLMQLPAKSRILVQGVLDSLPAGGKVQPEHLALLSEFSTTRTQGKYAPQSATIQGILSDMYSTFANDLEEAIRDEASANRKFEDYIYTKQVELDDFRATKQQKEENKAEAETMLADTTQAFDDTVRQKDEDIEFFDQTKKDCSAKNEEWVVRKEMRESEIEGIEKALEILTSDDARDLFAKAIKPGKETFFLQLESDDSMSASVRNAYMLLKHQASKSHSLRLAQLAVSIRSSKSGHFDKVMAEIEEVIQMLRDEGKADIEKRDECKAKFQSIESTVSDLTWKVSVNDKNIDKLEKLIALREEDKAKTISEIEDVAAQMEGMEKQRKEEHDEYNVAKNDDKAAIELLEKARDVLAKYYKENKIEMLQAGPDFAVSQDQAPEATFSSKGSRKGESKGIVSLMNMLIEDLEDEIKNGTKDEVDAQLEFEKAMEVAKKLKDSLEEKKTNLEETIAKREEEKVEEHRLKGINLNDKTAELDYKAQIKPDCDWIISSFEARAKAREGEMNGLQSAKEYLAGAKPSLLQQTTSMDDVSLSHIRFLGLRQ